MPQYLWLYMSNEKNPGWLGYVEDDILPKIYRNYFMNHEIRIPKKTNQVFQWKVVGFFFRGSTWLSYRLISPGQVINTLLPQIRRQLRRLVQSPRPRPPQICRNSKQAAAEGAGN